MNRFTSIFLVGLIASASALAISPKADAKTPVSYLAQLDGESYHRNDDGNHERENGHHRNGDNNHRYDRDHNHRYERDRNWCRG